MALRRIHDQAPESLAAFYSALADEGWEYVSRRMLDLIVAIEAHAVADTLWAFTSLTTLCITLIDDYRAPILRIGPLSGERYRLEYALPPQALPDTRHPAIRTNVTLDQTVVAVCAIIHLWHASGVLPSHNDAEQHDD